MPNIATFTHGRETLLVSKMIGPDGGFIYDGATHNSIKVVIPPGALPKATKLELLADNGTIHLNSGSSGEKFIRITAENIEEFNQPIAIQLLYDASRWKGCVVIGYCIEKGGRLSAIDSGPKDYSSGKASFITNRPTLITWVFAKY